MAALICLLQTLSLLVTLSITLAMAKLELSLTCPDNSTSQLVVTTTTSETLIGEVSSDLVPMTAIAVLNDAYGSLYLNTSGSYFLPSPVDGRLESIKTFGLLEEEIFTSELAQETALPIPTKLDYVPYMYAVVYRPSSDGGDYSLVFGPAEITHNFAPSTIEPDITVQKGDLIGLLLPRKCLNTKINTLCPSRPNLQSTNEKCSSAFFHPMDDPMMMKNVISSDEFTEVLVNLSMEAKIVPVSDKLGAILGCVLGVLGATAFITTIAIIVHVMMQRIRPKKESKAFFDNRIYGIPADKSLKQADPYSYVYEVPLSSHEYMEINTEKIRALPLRVVEGTSDSKKDEYDGEYDYATQDPFFEPADVEEELIQQLNATLLVTEIPSDHLKLENELGRGQFGQVFRGVLTTKKETNEEVLEEVAVKTMEGELTEEKRIKFLKEAVIMAQFKHPYVVCLKGILTDPQMMIVLDLMKGGDLREYLLTTMKESLKTLHPLETSSILLSYMRQIALGMHHFASKQYVHRDLAARNILMTGDGTTCKIADFGLSRDLQDQETYVSHGGKIPVKWTAPEALRYHKYSSASDIWSYGCVVYEIWSIGVKPFHDMTNVEVMKHVVAGNRLPPPPGCPRAVYSIMIKCWHPNADERPTFCDIIQALQMSDFHILKWSPEDLNTYSLDSRKLGFPLKYGKELYPDLQRIYLKKPLN